jgi:hypothetical protein
MKFILKDNYIFPMEAGVQKSGKISAEVVIKYVEGSDTRKYSYSLNNKPFKALQNGKIVFEEKDLQGPDIQLKIKAQGPQDTKIFKADSIPLRTVLVFGEDAEQAYPHRINAMEKEIQHIKETSLKILDYVEELEKKGRLL